MVSRVWRNRADRWPEYSLWVITVGMAIAFVQKLLKCQQSVWSGLAMVERKFSHCEIFIHRSGEVLNVLPMIVDDQGDSYDLDEASGRVDFMIPVSEIMRRAEAYRDNQDF